MQEPDTMAAALCAVAILVSAQLRRPVDSGAG